MATTTHRPSAAIFAAISSAIIAGGVVRIWQMATLAVSDDQIVAHSFFGTRRWSRDEVVGFTASTRPINNFGYRRRVLGVVLRDGSTQWLTSINCKPAKNDDTATWIDAAAAALSAK
jgi:hypothetical protein